MSLLTHFILESLEYLEEITTNSYFNNMKKAIGANPSAEGFYKKILDDYMKKEQEHRKQGMEPDLSPTEFAEYQALKKYFGVSTPDHTKASITGTLADRIAKRQRHKELRDLYNKGTISDSQFREMSKIEKELDIFTPPTTRGSTAQLLHDEHQKRLQEKRQRHEELRDLYNKGTITDSQFREMSKIEKELGIFKGSQPRTSSTVGVGDQEQKLSSVAKEVVTGTDHKSHGHVTTGTDQKPHVDVTPTTTPTTTPATPTKQGLSPMAKYGLAAGGAAATALALYGGYRWLKNRKKKQQEKEQSTHTA